jgi:uncharacterized membrane protein YvbJ
MKCPNCGASISETDIICPYCDTFFDDENDTSDPRANPENDKINAPVVAVSLIPIVGFIIAMVYYSMGYKKCGTASLVASFALIIVTILGSVCLSLILH